MQKLRVFLRLNNSKFHLVPKISKQKGKEIKWEANCIKYTKYALHWFLL